jgi:Holliday junction resolvase RusA-like endonuclease
MEKEIKTYIFNVDPNTKPRMTQRDKWTTRPATSKYWGYKDNIKLQANLQGLHTLPTTIESIQFIIPMPQSWSKKKKAEMDGQLHESAPDCDNFLKGIFDALCTEDKHIALIKGPLSKRWGYEGKIIIKI